MQNRQKGYLCALGAVMIWSGFILVSRRGGLSSLTAYDVIAIRYLSCAALLFPVWFFWKRFKLLQLKLIVSALIGGLSYALFAFNGFVQAPASHAAVLLPGLLPVMIIMLSSFLNGEQHQISKWLGVSVITFGIGVLFWQEYQLNGVFSQGHLCLAGAAFCWAVFSVLINRWNISPWEATVSLALVTATVYLPIYSLVLPKNISPSLWQDIVLQSFYQGFMATIVQMLLYVRAVQLIGASSMGSMMAIVPVLAGVGAIFIFNEPVRISLVMALVLVSTGIWLANTRWWHKRVSVSTTNP